MKISAIIITKNEELMLPACLKSLNWADEIVVVDSQSQDKTVALAKAKGAKVISVPEHSDYSSSRNRGLKAASHSWIFYLDADERVPKDLKEKIQSIISQKPSVPVSYKIPRQNIIFGRWLKHGGHWPDYVHRLFHRSALYKWTGKLHESPVIKGQVKYLKSPLKHYTARSISLALKKSAIWSRLEATLLFNANSPKVYGLKVIKALNLELFRILILKRGIFDGIRGFILAYIRAFHQASILVNLWQLQQKHK